MKGRVGGIFTSTISSVDGSYRVEKNKLISVLKVGCFVKLFFYLLTFYFLLTYFFYFFSYYYSYSDYCVLMVGVLWTPDAPPTFAFGKRQFDPSTFAWLSPSQLRLRLTIPYRSWVDCPY
jgi:hypothetical protein